MKKIYGLFVVVSLLFASCKPLDGTYSALDAIPVKTIVVTLNAADYASLPTANYAVKQLSFNSGTDANLYVPTILAAKYPKVASGTRANVTFALSPASSSIAVPDNLVSHISLTLTTTADYTYPATVVNGVTIPANSFANLTAAGAINFLTVKYQTPAANQMVLLTYAYYEGGVTAQTTDTFVYIKGVWTKLYTISPAQYALAGRGANNSFISTDVTRLVYTFNQFLLADPMIAATDKAGDVINVSYRYSTSATAINQYVLTLTFNGTNWIAQQMLPFYKLNGTWIPDPTVTLNEPDGAGNADYAYLNTTTVGTTLARSNLAQYGDFNLASGYWTDTDITNGFAAILLHKYSSPTVGIDYVVNYVVYKVTAVQTKTYNFNGTAFVLKQ